jgi:hypothetical protein
MLCEATMPRFAGAREARGCAFRSAAPPKSPSGIKTHRRASYEDVSPFRRDERILAAGVDGKIKLTIASEVRRQPGPFDVS